MIAELDAVVSSSQLSSLSDIDDVQLAEAVVALDAQERLTSKRRRALHEVIDSLTAEITRRYRTGEATVDALLS